MQKDILLAQLNDRHALQNNCSLKKTATQAVPGVGNANADILFIGEAPGKNEDEQGIPFVGASGKFIDQMLSRAKLKRSDVYITNIVKYRPPQNRDPLPSEVSACEEWLHDQIQLIKPSIIVTLGRHALEHFVPGEKISEAHGHLFKRTLPDLGELTFFALYHPAAALYNGSMRQTLIEDFLKVPIIIKKIKKSSI